MLEIGKGRRLTGIAIRALGAESSGQAGHPQGLEFNSHGGVEVKRLTEILKTATLLFIHQSEGFA